MLSCGLLFSQPLSRQTSVLTLIFIQKRSDAMATCHPFVQGIDTVLIRLSNLRHSSQWYQAPLAYSLFGKMRCNHTDLIHYPYTIHTSSIQYRYTWQAIVSFLKNTFRLTFINYQRSRRISNASRKKGNTPFKPGRCIRWLNR